MYSSGLNMYKFQKEPLPPSRWITKPMNLEKTKWLVIWDGVQLENKCLCSSEIIPQSLHSSIALRAHVSVWIESCACCSDVPHVRAHLVTTELPPETNSACCSEVPQQFSEHCGVLCRLPHNCYSAAGVSGVICL